MSPSLLFLISSLFPCYFWLLSAFLVTFRRRTWSSEALREVCPDRAANTIPGGYPWIQRRAEERREAKPRSRVSQTINLTEGPWVISLKIHWQSCSFKPLKQTELSWVKEQISRRRRRQSEMLIDLPPGNYVTYFIVFAFFVFTARIMVSSLTE